MCRKYDTILQQISQEFYHANRILGSCSTKEQVKNIQGWLNLIIERWDRYLEPIPMRIYNKHYKKFIIDIITSLQNQYSELEKELTPKEEKEEEPKYPKIFVVKGFE